MWVEEVVSFFEGMDEVHGFPNKFYIKKDNSLKIFKCKRPKEKKKIKNQKLSEIKLSDHRNNFA